MISRKLFLQMLATAGVGTLGHSLLGQTSIPIKTGPTIPWGRLRFRASGNDDKDWSVHPNGDMNLIDHIGTNTSVNLGKKWNVADVGSLKELSAFPFLFMHAERAPVLSDAERKNLREYLLRGGFLFAEDCVIGNGGMGDSPRNDFFFRQMAETEFGKILPEARLIRLPNDHPVFHTVFHMRNGMPHMQGTPHGLHGLELNGRIVALLSPSDLHCGWTNGDRWFGAGENQIALQMGTNIYAFAMTQT
jgi:hypothetical protein